MRFRTAQVSRYTAALALSLLIASPAAARPAGPSSTASVVDLAKIRIQNFGRVNENYYRGAQPKQGDYAALAALGVRTIINLTSDDVDGQEQAMAKNAGLAYVQIPMTTHQPPTASQIAEFLKIVSDRVQQPVYVHCVGGRHRTGVMTAVYRMVRDGWTADRAFQEMKQYKFGADFLHPEFRQFVYSYGAELARANAAAAPAPSGTAPSGR